MLLLVSLSQKSVSIIDSPNYLTNFVLKLVSFINKAIKSRRDIVVYSENKNIIQKEPKFNANESK